MSDKFTLGVGLAHEFEMAMNRAGKWNSALVKRMCEGDRLSHIREYLLGLAEIKEIKHFRLIKGNIMVRTEAFVRDTFFSGNGPAKLYLWKGFEAQVFPAIPEVVSAFEGSLMKTELTKYMYNSEILKELGCERALFSPAKFAAVIHDLITRQPKGEEGTLLVNGYANIFYVWLGDGPVIVVDVHWRANTDHWHLLVRSLGGDGWGGGRCVFSRS